MFVMSVRNILHRIYILLLISSPTERTVCTVAIPLVRMYQITVIFLCLGKFMQERTSLVVIHAIKVSHKEYI